MLFEVWGVDEDEDLGVFVHVLREVGEDRLRFGVLASA